MARLFHEWLTNYLEQMMFRLTEYFKSTAATKLPLPERFRIYAWMFLIIAFSVIILHQFMDQTQSIGSLIYHAIEIGAYYMLFGLLGLEAMIYLKWRVKKDKTLLIWEVWMLFLATFSIGVLAFPAILNQHNIASSHPPHMPDTFFSNYILFLPVWAAISFVFVQALRYRELILEKQRFHKTNARFTDNTVFPNPEKPSISEHQNSSTEIRIKSDGKLVNIIVSNIIYVKVVEHYCYIYVTEEKISRPFITHLALRNLLTMLPKNEFLQTHRSYVINLNFTSSIEKDDNKHAVHLCGRRYLVPISKHRLNHILPKLEKALSSKKSS